MTKIEFPEELKESARRAVDAALAEDVGSGDVTTLAVVNPESKTRASLVARQEMVVAGLEFARLTFDIVDMGLQFTPAVNDGDTTKPGDVIATIQGVTASILTAERVALNFIQRLSGVATLTRQYVDRLEGLPCEILDTRKTTPGWRDFEKYAVRCGGGTNHRQGLYDMVLIKDNHLAAFPDDGVDPVAKAIYLARGRFPHLQVEVEADTLQQAANAAEAGADIILLDNMSLDDLRVAVDRIAGRSLTEASGGVSLETLRAIAETGVDRISVGALTHSAPAVDIALDFTHSSQ